MADRKGRSITIPSESYILEDDGSRLKEKFRLKLAGSTEVNAGPTNSNLENVYADDRIEEVIGVTNDSFLPTTTPATATAHDVATENATPLKGNDIVAYSKLSPYLSISTSHYEPATQDSSALTEIEMEISPITIHQLDQETMSENAAGSSDSLLRSADHEHIGVSLRSESWIIKARLAISGKRKKARSNTSAFSSSKSQLLDPRETVSSPTSPALKSRSSFQILKNIPSSHARKGPLLTVANKKRGIGIMEALQLEPSKYRGSVDLQGANFSDLDSKWTQASECVRASLSEPKLNTAPLPYPTASRRADSGANPQFSEGNRAELLDALQNIDILQEWEIGQGIFSDVTPSGSISANANDSQSDEFSTVLGKMLDMTFNKPLSEEAIRNSSDRSSSIELIDMLAALRDTDRILSDVSNVSSDAEPNTLSVRVRSSFSRLAAKVGLESSQNVIAPRESSRIYTLQKDQTDYHGDREGAESSFSRVSDARSLLIEQAPKTRPSIDSTDDIPLAEFLNQSESFQSSVNETQDTITRPHKNPSRLANSTNLQMEKLPNLKKKKSFIHSIGNFFSGSRSKDTSLLLTPQPSSTHSSISESPADLISSSNFLDITPHVEYGDDDMIRNLSQKLTNAAVDRNSEQFQRYVQDLAELIKNSTRKSQSGWI